MTSWLDSKTAESPVDLRRRVVQLAQGHAREGGSLRDQLASAAAEALDAVVAHPGDRSIALDLLSADALITLALLHQAEDDPGRLGWYADQLVSGSSESDDT